MCFKFPLLTLTCTMLISVASAEEKLKTFSKYGVSFRYPEGWNLMEVNGGFVATVTVTNDKETTVSLLIPLLRPGSAQQWLKTAKQSLEEKPSVKKVTEVKRKLFGRLVSGIRATGTEKIDTEKVPVTSETYCLEVKKLHRLFMIVTSHSPKLAPKDGKKVVAVLQSLKLK